MHIRKTIISFGLLCTAICLSGCQAAEPAEAAPYFVFATPLDNSPIWSHAQAGFEDACQELNVHGDWLGPNIIDVPAMEEIIETAILEKADGIITQGVVDESILREAAEKDIPVVLVDSDMSEENRLCFLGKDFHEQALLFLEDIENRLGKDEPLKIAIQAANLDFQIAKDQISEIEEVFASHPGGFEIVSLSQSLSDTVRGLKEWQRVMEEHPDLNIAICFAGESGCVCVDAAVEWGMEDQVLIYGVDNMDQTMEYVRDEKLTGTLVTSFYDYGWRSVEILREYLETGKEPESVEINLMLVTKENYEDWKKNEQKESESADPA